mmetsp:Transcript_6889/g.13276  ORF Transcript_6889/g.13276 Transcript_6889/m.13276 type:complete len:211 (+) Transcript_6889:473-1105(+)
MYRPSRENLISAMLLMISLKKLRLDGSSSSSNTLECSSQRALLRMSASLIEPLLLLQRKVLHCVGWHTAAVMTSVSSSMLSGLISTMLNEVPLMSKFHRLIRRSSADRNVSLSLTSDTELIWYACPLANVLRGHAIMRRSLLYKGSRKACREPPLGALVYCSTRATGRSRSRTRQSLTVLSFVVRSISELLMGLSHLRQLIFSSISRDLR